VALELDPAFRERLLGVLAQLRTTIAGVRWVRPEGLHLTLRFLGDARPEQLSAVQAALHTAALACPPVEALSGGLGCFPPRGGARVVWVGLALPEAALALQRDCEAAAVAAGFYREERPFSAHVTLGRCERPQRLTLPAAELGVARLEQLTLFRSQLTAGGSVYTPLARWPLGSTP
jgi:2'-5' RNA ligase